MVECRTSFYRIFDLPLVAYIRQCRYSFLTNPSNIFSPKIPSTHSIIYACRTFDTSKLKLSEIVVKGIRSQLFMGNVVKTVIDTVINSVWREDLYEHCGECRLSCGWLSRGCPAVNERYIQKRQQLQETSRTCLNICMHFTCL